MSTTVPPAEQCTPSTDRGGPGTQPRPPWPGGDDAPGAAGRRGIALATGASLVVVVALWLTGGGLTSITGPGDALTSLGRLTGLLAANLLLIQVLLIARIPAVERSYGQDPLVRRHRSVGMASFVLMAVHVVLVVGGYAQGQVGRVWSAAGDIVLTMPGMVLAVAGFAALSLVVVTSVARARRRLRYETWHLLHLYAYLGCFLALPHQLWTGTDLLSSPAATAYWWALWAAAAAAVLGYRVGLPIYVNWRHRLRVEHVRPTGAAATVVTVTGRDLDRLGALPGQFFTWRFLDGPGWSRANPYSLCAAPDGQALQLCVAHVGDGSSRVARLRPGARVLVEGPYGRLPPGVRTRAKVALIAGGIGIGPLASLLDGLPGGPGELTVVYRTHDRRTAALLPEVVALAGRRGARLLVLDGPRPAGRPSWLPAAWAHTDDVTALRQLIPDIAEHDVYVCGGDAWMDLVEAALAGAGVPRQAVHAERFGY